MNAGDGGGRWSVFDGLKFARDNSASCECYHTCAEDPDTACSLSGDWHVHPGEPCPVHPRRTRRPLMNVPWLETPWDEMTAEQIMATPVYQLEMMAQRDLFARNGRLEEWECSTRPVLWPDLMPEGWVPEQPAPQRERPRGLLSRIFRGDR